MARTATAGMAATKARRTIADRSTAPHKPAGRRADAAPRAQLLGGADARYRFRRLGVFDHPRGVLRHANIRGLSLRARHPAGDLDGPVEKAERLGIFRQVATAIPNRNEYRLTKMGFDLYPSFIALMGVWRCVVVRQKAAAHHAHSRALRLRQSSRGRVFPLPQGAHPKGGRVPRRPRRGPVASETRPQHETRFRWEPLSHRAPQLGFQGAPGDR